MDLDLDLQEKSPHHSTTGGVSDILYSRLIAQVTGEGGTEDGVLFPLNGDLYNPAIFNKHIPGFRQFPLVRFIHYRYKYKYSSIQLTALFDTDGLVTPYF